MPEDDSAMEGADYIGRPTASDGYIGIANDMLRGLGILAESSAPGLALPFVSAHILECALKAYITRTGDDSKVKAHEIRHNLDKLWDVACAMGLKLPDPKPYWLEKLSGLHAPPFYLRYATGVHGIVSPSPKILSEDIVSILAVVNESLRM